MEKIGIIGVGFVGNAIRQAYTDTAETVLMDPAKGFTASYQDMVGCDAVFICLPTPQSTSGECDTSLLVSALDELATVGYNGVVISKCTAPPMSYKHLQMVFPNLVHIPGFLTAAKAVRDYAQGEFAFIGGSDISCMHYAERIIRLSQKNLRSVAYCTIAEAALAKYTINTFLATKVAFMNEIEALATKMGIDYDIVASMVTLDGRIGSSHMQVPGPDGHYGFGGACFPKDTSAMLKFAEKIGISMSLVEAAVVLNASLRADLCMK